MIQLQVLNWILATGNSFFIISNNLTEDFFSDYPEEFKYILEHINKYGNVPDLVTFLDTFPDFDVLEVNENSDYLLDKLYEDKNKRFLAKSFNTIRDLLNSGKVDEAMSYYTSTSNIAVEAKHVGCTDLLKDTSRYEAYLERCEDFNKFYIKTGFKELDEIIGGWDRQEELATIAARTNMGKSWVLLKCAVAALEQGLKVGIYSGEMSARKVGYRVDTIISHIPNRG